MITIIITITDYSLAVTVYIGFLHSAGNMQGVISVTTCSFMHHFINITSVDANTGNMYLFHVLLAMATVIAVITCDYSNYFV